MRRIGVCRYCTERYLACHDYCEKYKEAYAKETERIEQANKQRLGDKEHLQYLRADKEKRRRKHL